MTTVIAWVRALPDCEELVFVSDSRLSGDGRVFDCCPKILTLPRTDSVIAYAGYTGHAFPMILQFQRAIDSYAPSRRGSLDISSLKSHALKIFDRMAESIEGSPHVSKEQSVAPEASFVLGGYSWIKKEFELWIISYSVANSRFEARPANWIGFSAEADKYLVRKTKLPLPDTDRYHKIAFAGDQSARAKELLLCKLNAEKSVHVKSQGLNWQPFEVVRDMLRDSRHPESIGGAPQVVKVYQYMQSASLGVYWASKNDEKYQVFLQGRPCLGYERIDNWILDPDTLESGHLVFAPMEQEFLAEVEAAAQDYANSD